MIYLYYSEEHSSKCYYKKKNELIAFSLLEWTSQNSECCCCYLRLCLRETRGQTRVQVLEKHFIWATISHGASRTIFLQTSHNSLKHSRKL